MEDARKSAFGPIFAPQTPLAQVPRSLETARECEYQLDLFGIGSAIEPILMKSARCRGPWAAIYGPICKELQLSYSEAVAELRPQRGMGLSFAWCFQECQRVPCLLLLGRHDAI